MPSCPSCLRSRSGPVCWLLWKRCCLQRRVGGGPCRCSRMFLFFCRYLIVNYFVRQALALLCSLCVICGATMSRPEGFAHSSPPLDLDLEPDNDLNTTSGSEQHSHRDSSGRRGLLVLLLGSDLASSPLLRFNINAYLRKLS